MELLPPAQPNEEKGRAAPPLLIGKAAAALPPVVLPAVGALTLGLLFALAAGGAYAYLDAQQASQLAAARAATLAPSEAAAPGVQAAFDGVAIMAQGAFVVDATAGTILYAHNPDTQLPLASLTKAALVLAAAQALPPDSLVTIRRVIPPTSTTGAIPAGTAWRARDLAAFTLVGSSNGGAEALAEAADEPIRARYPQAPAGSAAVWLMNDIARRQGGPNMYFLNPSGLDESATQSGGYGTARSVAGLFAYAASTSPDLFASTARKEITITSQDGRAVVASNTDEALDDIPGIMMGKTGYTELAGGNLAVVFEVQGHRIVAVVLGSTKDGRFSDMKALVSAARKAVEGK